MKKINIAIDGPSAAGKSTIADELAKKLGYIHIDTGAMYRLVGYKANQLKIDLDDEEALSEMIKNTTIVQNLDGTHLLDGKLIKDEIRTNEMSMIASKVSKHLKVREALVKMQQEWSLNKGFILDGRDIGTVVLKDNAEVKIFMTASSYARANRRHKQNLEKGIPSDLDTLIKEIEQRDYQDTHRANSPLKKASDAIGIDTSDLTIDEVVLKIMEIVKTKL